MAVPDSNRTKQNLGYCRFLSCSPRIVVVESGLLVYPDRSFTRFPFRSHHRQHFASAANSICRMRSFDTPRTALISFRVMSVSLGRERAIAPHKLNVRYLERARGLANFLAYSLVVLAGNHKADGQI